MNDAGICARSSASSGCPAAVAHPQLRIGQHLGALKADGDTELAACTILFYPENLSQAPDSAPCPSGHFWSQFDDKPNPLPAPDRLTTVEECTPGGEVFHQGGDHVTLTPQRQGDILLKRKPEALAALSIVHRSLRRKLDLHTQTGGWCLQD